MNIPTDALPGPDPSITALPLSGPIASEVLDSVNPITAASPPTAAKAAVVTQTGSDAVVPTAAQAASRSVQVESVPGLPKTQKQQLLYNIPEGCQTKQQ